MSILKGISIVSLALDMSHATSSPVGRDTFSAITGISSSPPLIELLHEANIQDDIAITIPCTDFVNKKLCFSIMKILIWFEAKLRICILNIKISVGQIIITLWL